MLIMFFGICRIIETRQKNLTVMHELPNDVSMFFDILIVTELVLTLIDWIPSQYSFRTEVCYSS